MLKIRHLFKKIDTVFVILLFLLFTITALVFIFIGIKQYQLTTDSLAYNYEVRTATAYLTDTIRQNDTNGGLSIISLNTGEDSTAIDSLALSSHTSDTDCLTYIYCFDGYLRSLSVDSDAMYDLSLGNEIVEMTSLTFSEQSKNIIKAEIVTTDNNSTTVILSTKSLSRGFFNE